jgi:L-rhamnose-H+ transport protein
MNLFFGFLLILVSGTMAGTALLPIKFIRRYKFENYWLLYGLMSTVIIPWALAFLSTPHLFQIYSQLPWKTLLLPPLFAFSWGIASMLGGLCVARIGLSLTYALIIGMGAVAGSIVPLLYFSPQTFRTPAGHYILLGITVMLAGLALATWAGRQNETQIAAHAGGSGIAESWKSKQGSYLAWVAIGIFAGILSAGLNFSFAFGQDVAVAAQAAGASAASATYPIWALAMLGGMIPNVGYPMFLCFRNRSWGVFRSAPLCDLAFSLSLGILFMGSTSLYGLGAVHLGLLGTSVGWGIMQIMQIVVGNISGFLTGEWRYADRRAVRLMVAGIALLALASIVMAYGNYVQEQHQPLPSEAMVVRDLSVFAHWQVPIPCTWWKQPTAQGKLNLHAPNNRTILSRESSICASMAARA